jgi:hypothetical protein
MMRRFFERMPSLQQVIWLVILSLMMLLIRLKQRIKLLNFDSTYLMTEVKDNDFSLSK